MFSEQKKDLRIIIIRGFYLSIFCLIALESCPIVYLVQTNSVAGTLCILSLGFVEMKGHTLVRDEIILKLRNALKKGYLKVISSKANQPISNKLLNLSKSILG